MATGDSDDILARVKRDLPARWFAKAAPIRDAIMGGLADLASWSYSLTVYAGQQTRLASANGIWLDIFAYDYLRLHLRRRGSNDDTFRARIKATILQERVTRAGMVSVLTQLTGRAPIIFEPWNTGDAGAWDVGAIAWQGDKYVQPGGGWDAGCGWDQNAAGFDIQPSTVYGAVGGVGGWGSTDMPAQVLISTSPAIEQGVPNVGGYDAPPLGWDSPNGEWISDAEEGSLTTQDIYDAINVTKPTGVIAWVRLQ